MTASKTKVKTKKSNGNGGLLELVARTVAEGSERLCYIEKYLDRHDKRLESHDRQLENIDRKLNYVTSKLPAHEVWLTKIEKCMATKDDLTGMATKEDLASLEKKMTAKINTIKKNVATIEKNMATKEDLTGMATKGDLAGMATKKDLASMATKEDLLTVRSDIASMNQKVDKLVGLYEHDKVETGARFERLEKDLPPWKR